MYVDTSVRPQGEQVDAVAPAKLKLSAAIRIGAKIRPQGKGALFSEGRSCALGAAYEGATGYQLYDPNDLSPILKLFLGIQPEIFPRIVARNDEDGWSRESIADWLEAQGL